MPNVIPEHLVNEFKGKPGFVVASGPSLTREDCELLQGKNVVAVNCSFRLAPFANILYACDHKWWKAYENEWNGFKGEKITIGLSALIEYPELIGLETEQRETLSKDLNKLSSGGNSGYQAANLLFLLGCNPIYLIGFDMKPTAGNNHFHEDHDKTKTVILKGSKHRERLNNPTPYLYKQWIKNISNLHLAMKAEGVDLINCSRETALTIPQKALEDALSEKP